MVGQYLPQTNKKCYIVLQCPLCLFLPLFQGSKHSRGVETLSFPRVPVLRRLAASLHAPSPRLRVLRRLALHTRSTASSAPSNPGGSHRPQPSSSPSNSSIHSGSPSSIPRFPVSLSLLACVPSSLNSYCTSSLFRFELPLLWCTDLNLVKFTSHAISVRCVLMLRIDKFAWTIFSMFLGEETT